MPDDLITASLEALFEEMTEQLLREIDLAAAMCAGTPFMVRIGATDEGGLFIRLERDIYR